MISGLEELLQRYPFFRDMDAEVRKTVAGCAANERIEAGQYIFREGETADKFFLLRDGQVALEISTAGRRPLIVDTVRAGEIFGWNWIIPPYSWRADARATERSRLLSLDAKCLRGKMESDHRLGYEMYQRFFPVIAKRLEGTRLRLIDLYGHPDEQQL
jgi:CRP/FNR family transcriptional regulator, cyclic AMP receptor protein